MTRPQLRADQYQTYAIKRPAATHWKPATCEQVGCPSHLHGWRTEIDEHTELGASQAHYIRAESGRAFTEQRHPVARTTVFVFDAGQACFQAARHRAPIEREPLYVVRGGDARGNPARFRRVHASADSWVDDFATNQDHLNTAAQRG